MDNLFEAFATAKKETRQFFLPMRVDAIRQRDLLDHRKADKCNVLSPAASSP